MSHEENSMDDSLLIPVSGLEPPKLIKYPINNRSDKKWNKRRDTTDISTSPTPITTTTSTASTPSPTDLEKIQERRKSNGDLHESDVDSDAASDNGEESEICTDKMDPADRELYEKLKQQEREEREEIERELKAHEEAIARQHEELRAKDLRLHERIQQHREQDLRKHPISTGTGSTGSGNGSTGNGGNGGNGSSGSNTGSANTGSGSGNGGGGGGGGGGASGAGSITSVGSVGLGTGSGASPVDYVTTPPGAHSRLSSTGDLKADHSRLDLINHAAYLERFAAAAAAAAAGGVINRGLPGAPTLASLPPASVPSHTVPNPSVDTTGPSHHWTFQEQFKQMPNEMSLLKSLYELSEDPKRKEFLDDLFSFMQKRGTPVNRIPIMAKQTLDLYELFRLVVSKGGLVEVINKKLWREITKGLNLPSSITSAAFTLRTQYMKYLYPYECEKLKLSSPQELQAAIDGNRREGRRPSYGYDLSPGPTLLPNPHHHLNGNLLNGKLGGNSPGVAPADYIWWGSRRICLKPDSDDDSLPSTPIQSRSLSERDALAMEAASRAMEEATRKMEAASRAAVEESPPRKRLAMSDEERILVHAGMPSAHIKITSRNDGRSEIDNSLVVSMEINGIMYQGVLFAQQARRI